MWADEMERRMKKVEDWISRQISKNQGSPSGTWLPTWSSTGTQPVIGNGLLSGHYFIRGGLCKDIIYFAPGASTTFGTGNYSFSLSHTVSASGLTAVGIAVLYSIGSGRFTRFPFVGSGATTLSVFNPVTDGGTTIYLTPTVPFTWANGDLMRVNIEYEI